LLFLKELLKLSFAFEQAGVLNKLRTKVLRWHKSPLIEEAHRWRFHPWASLIRGGSFSAMPVKDFSKFARRNV